MSPQSPVLRQNGAKSPPFVLSVFILIAFFACAFQARAQVTYTGAANSLASLPSGDTISPIAVDSSGDAFFVLNNGTSNALYKVAAGGTTTVLNSSFPYSPSALAVTPAGDRLFMIYTGSTPQSCQSLVYQYLATVSTTAGATPANMPGCFYHGYNAFYSDPTGLATDSSGNLYVADFGGGVIWQLSAPVTSTSVPSEMLEFLNQQPYDIAVLGSTIYFTALNPNTSASTLYSVSASNFSTGIPSGPASVNPLVVVPSIQSGLAVDSNGNVYLGTGSGVDEYSGGSLTTVSGTAGDSVTGVAVDSSNNLYFAGTDGSGNPVIAEQSTQSVNFHSVNVGSASSTVSLGFTIGASTSTTVGSVHIYTQGVSGLDFADAGSSTCTAKTYASSTNCVINVKLTPRNAGLRSGAVVLSDGSGNALGTVYVYGTGVGPQVAFGPGVQSTVTSGLSFPYGIAVDVSSNVYIADAQNNRVVKEPWTGSAYGTQTMVGSGLSLPSAVAVDGAGNVYVADFGNSRVVRVPWTGTGYGTQTTVGSGLSEPLGVAVDGGGNVYIGDWGNGRVVKEPWTGSAYGTQTTVVSGFNPRELAVDASGNVYAADQTNSRVVKVPWTGSGYGTQTTVGSGLSAPFGVAVDGGGDVYIADTGNGRVVRVPWTGSSYGTQTTVGSGTSDPLDVAVDGGGNVYIADGNTNSAVKVDLADAPSLSFATTPVGSESSDSPKSVTIFNVGNAALTFPIPTSGNNPAISSGFAPDAATTCPELTTSSSAGSLGQGASCVYAADFIPVASGAASGSLMMKDNNLNAAGPSYTTQSISLSGTGQLQITLSPSSLTAGTVGTVYSQTISASSGTAPYTFAVTAGSLPAGLSLSSAGVLSGTPTAGGTFNLTVTATDSASKTASQTYTLTVNAPTIALLPISMPSATVGTAYSQTATGSGGTAPFSYALTAGALPAGLTLNSGGVLTGTATAAGTFNFTITATDSSTGTGPYIGSRAYSLTVAAPTITVSPASLPNATDGVSYSQSVSAAGGTAPYTYAVTAGALPAGTSLSSSGVLSGTPTAAGSFSFTITATDHSTGSGPFTGSKAYTLTVNAPTVTVSLATFPGGTYNSAYSQSLSTSGGTSPYSYSVTSGALPSGLTLSSAGVLSGTPTAAGSFTFTAAATDSSTGTGPFTGSQAYTIVINKASQTITFNAPASPVTYGISPITLSGSATSGQAVSYSLVSGPATVSGNTLTITGAGTVVVAADQAGNSNYTAAPQATATIVVNKASQTISFTPPASPVAYGVPAIALSATSNSGLPVSFTVLSGPATVSGSALSVTGVGTVVVAANQAGNTNYTAAPQVTESIVVNQTALTVAANNSSRVYGTANPAFTGAVSGSVNGDAFTESFSTPAAITSNAGTYAIVPAVTGANLANYSVAVQDGTLTITQAGTTTSLGISSASITPGQSVTLTAQVASLTTGSPTGGVSFYDGVTLLGTSPVAGGSAAFATSSLTAGTTHTLTAIYNGDVNFTSSSTTASTSVAVAALDFTFTLSGPTSQTVVPGSSVNFQVTVDPLYGSYAGPLNFNATGLPPGATVSFSPTIIATNAGQQTVTLSIQTAGVTAMHAQPSIARRLAPLSLGLLLLPLAGTRRMRKQGGRLNRFLVLILLFGGMAATATLTGCGSKNGFFTQAQKNYDVTITAAAGSITHTVTVTIQVQ